ncbi:cardiolipin synthase ClsB [soil metagenome]
MTGPPPQPEFTVDGNVLQLLDTGPRRLDALLTLMAEAKTSLRILYYIYVDDETGAKVRQGMIDAAARGVKVALIVDGMGSEKAAQHKFFDPLREADVEVCRFVPRWGRQYLLRNHQKLAIADENRAIIGGFNVSDDYFGTAAEAAWRDLGMLITGPQVAHLAGYFDALAAWAKRPKASLRRLNRALRTWSEPQGKTRWLFGGPTRRLSPWARAVRQDMRVARSIDLIAGYFAPNPAMLRRLDKAGKRGQVRIVLPAKTDHGMAIWASRFTYAGLLRKRVEIYEYQSTKLHTKLFRIDDVAYIGSANFDIRSMFLNLELMFRVEDAAFAAHCRSYFEGEMARSERITKEWWREHATFWTRVKQAGAYFVMTVLDLNVTRRLNMEPRPKLPE